MMRAPESLTVSRPRHRIVRHIDLLSSEIRDEKRSKMRTQKQVCIPETLTICFPVIAKKLPVRLKIFPVPSLREFAKINAQCQHVAKKSKANFGYICKLSLFFPCLTGKSPLGPQRRVRSRLPAPPPSQAQCAVSPARRGDWRKRDWLWRVLSCMDAPVVARE
jgi:hypothetical protein